MWWESFNKPRSLKTYHEFQIYHRGKGIYLQLQKGTEDNRIVLL